MTLAIKTWSKAGAGAGAYSPSVRYPHRDHLGSVVAITTETGSVESRSSFDVWGKRRDPTLQFPESTQGYNRYAYAGNNPLTFTDPSGFSFWKKLMRWVGIAMSIFIPTGINLLWEKLLWGFTSGFMASGGNLKAGLLSALGAGLFHGTHLLQSKMGLFAHSLLKGLAGGALSALAGGKFGAGFLGAFAGGILGETIGIGGQSGTGTRADMLVRVMRDAIIGGVASVLGGGKFKNGAITAAFARLYNDELNGPDLTKKEEKDKNNSDTRKPRQLETSPSLETFVSEAAVGFGDGVYRAITLGIGNLEDVRWLLGIDPYVPTDGIVYSDAFKIGMVEGGVALGGSATTGLFRRGGWANRGPNRIGVGKHNGYKVFRIAGDWVKNDSGYIDLFKLGKWP